MPMELRCTHIDEAGAGRGLHRWEHSGSLYSCTSCGTKLVVDELLHAYFAAGRQLTPVSRLIAPLSAMIYRDANPAAMASRASIGSAVHAATAAIDTGAAPAVDNGYVAAYRAYLAAEQPAYVAIEHPVLDIAAGYAGTIDRVRLRDDGAVEIIDIKTSAAVHPGLYAMQLWGYAQAAGLPRAHLSILHLRPDGTYAVHDLSPGDDRREEYERVWQALTALNEWLAKQHG